MAKLLGIKPPKLPPPKPMPDMDDPQIQDARRRRVAKEVRRSGSQSTILSDGGKETLG